MTKTIFRVSSKEIKIKTTSLQMHCPEVYNPEYQRWIHFKHVTLKLTPAIHKKIIELLPTGKMIKCDYSSDPSHFYLEVTAEDGKVIDVKDSKFKDNSDKWA